MKSIPTGKAALADMMWCCFRREQGLDAILMEFKVRNPKKEKSLEETAQEALAQIKEKRYAEELVKRGIAPECIRSLGFAFEGKRVLIEEQPYSFLHFPHE